MIRPEVQVIMDHPHGGELLYDKALEYAKTLPPERIFLEIGCYKGGSTMALIQAVHDSGVPRWVFSVDPYGTKPFKLGMGIQEEADYSDEIYREAIHNMASFASMLKVNHYHWRLTSDDFMRILPIIEFWSGGTKIEPKFGFSYIDGDHNCYTVERELTWLKERTKGMIVFDDVPYVDMENRPIIKQALKEGHVDNFRCYWEIP